MALPTVVPDMDALGGLDMAEGMEVNVQYTQYDSGVGAPKIR